MAAPSVHSWRLFAPDEADNSFRISRELTLMTATTETEPIDTWFSDEVVVFAGRAEIPDGPHIKQRPCECSGGCEECCYTGSTYHWVETPLSLIEEAIREIKRIMADLSRVSS